MERWNCRLELGTAGAAHLSGQLREEVLVHGQGAQVVQVPDGGGQRLQLVAAAVEFLQQGQAAVGNPWLVAEQGLEHEMNACPRLQCTQKSGFYHQPLNQVGQ